MTDEELKALVASLAVNQQKTDAQMAVSDMKLTQLIEHQAKIAEQLAKTDAQLAKTDAQLAKTDAQLAETDAQLAKTDAQLAKTDAQLAKTDAQLAETDAQLAKTDAQLAKTDAQLAKTDAQLAKTDAQLAKTDAKLDRIFEMYGGVSNNQGAVAEEFYFNSLKAKPVLNGMRFDFIEKNITRCYQGLEDEFDLVLINGQSVFIIEVKYKAHKRDLKHLVESKAVNFKKLFPQYRGFQHHLGLATFHAYDELKKATLAQGVTLLQRKGDVVETLAA